MTSLSLFAFFVILGTSLGWSSLDLLRKMMLKTLRPVALLCLLTLAQSLGFAVWVMLDSGDGVTAGYWLPALGSILLNVVANIAFVEALAMTPLSLTIPLLSLTPAMAALVAIPVVGEMPSIWQAMGILLVVVGALYLNMEDGWMSLAALGRALKEHRGSQLMVLVALMWSASIPLDKLALGAAPGQIHALVLSLGVASGAFVVLLARGQIGDLKDVRRIPGLFTASLVVSASSLALQLTALTLAWVGLIETFKRVIGNLMALILGRVFFKEAITGHNIAAVALMILGVVLISM